MALYPDLVRRSIDELSKLPGIGQKSAERIVFHLLERPKEETKRLASALFYMREKIRFCQVCNNFSESEICPICADADRDKSVLCIVERPSDVSVIEKTGYYKGMYYVLLGSLSPVDEGKKALNLTKLKKILESGLVREVIIATDADSEGEITALYLQEFLSSYPVSMSRIGMGIPVGANIEYMDAVTIAKAIETRTRIR